MAEYFSFQAAFLFAVSHVMIRRGLVGSNAITGSFISLTMSASVLWLLSLFFIPLPSFWSPALGYFLLAGIFAPGLGRTLNYVGIEKIGVARAVPVTNASPMFASVFAFAFLGEEWTLVNILGTSMVVLGVLILSTTKPRKGEWRKIDAIYPILGAVSFGISANLRKLGLTVHNLPLMAATVTATTAFLFSLGMLSSKGGSQPFDLPRRSLGWLVVAGAVNTCAMLSAFYALSYGKVVTVEPLVSTNPVISILLSTIFLRDLEAVTSRVVLGAACTVTGTILVVMA